MKIRSSGLAVVVELSGPEARILFEELEHVRGGSKMPKIRQVCAGLAGLFFLNDTPLIEYDLKKRKRS